MSQKTGCSDSVYSVRICTASASYSLSLSQLSSQSEPPFPTLLHLSFKVKQTLLHKEAECYHYEKGFCRPELDLAACAGWGAAVCPCVCSMNQRSPSPLPMESDLQWVPHSCVHFGAQSERTVQQSPPFMPATYQPPTQYKCLKTREGKDRMSSTNHTLFPTSWGHIFSLVMLMDAALVSISSSGSTEHKWFTAINNTMKFSMVYTNKSTSRKNPCEFSKLIQVKKLSRLSFIIFPSRFWIAWEQGKKFLFWEPTQIEQMEGVR